MGSFEKTVGVLGLLLVAGALLSGLARRSVLSLAALFVLAGFILGKGALGVLHFDARSSFVSELATVVLVVILFHDGLEVEGEFLRRQWHLPLRKLVVGMPITAAIVAVVAHVTVGLSWIEAFLLGALLSPTDPVLSAGVVTDLRVPAIIRHSLNIESGLNDGLALPAVLALAAALNKISEPHFVWWHFALQDLGLGLVFGVACGLIGSFLMPRASPGRPRSEIPNHQKALYGLGVAFATYSVTVLPPHGNGLIAVFVAAVVIGNRRPNLRSHIIAGVEEIAEILKLGIFAVFGSLLTFHGLFNDGWAAAAVVGATFLLARPLAISVALAGTRLDWATKVFIGWFGPKGVATITFSLLILGGHVASGSRIFNVAALVVFSSILLHGITDTPGANWIARRNRPAAGDLQEMPPVDTS
jgi:NhaP-type Na+/H+ or K+/H+ antiporter